MTQHTATQTSSSGGSGATPPCRVASGGPTIRVPHPQGLFATYHDRLPQGDPTHLVNLGEGGTPLVKSRHIGPQAGLEQLYFKLEQLNPTGSYKDRFAGLMVSLMLEHGETRCIATSSGNTGSALAAYCARYGVECHLFLNEHTPEGKLSQMQAYGARLYRVRGFGRSRAESEAIFDRLQTYSEEHSIPLVVSAYRYCPEGMEGVKTLAFELAEQPEAIDDVFVPVGGGGLLTATWRGFRELAEPAPRINAVQPVLNDTMITALREGAERARGVDTVTTISGLAVPQDIDATSALTAVRESGGGGYLVEDEEARQVQRSLMASEGLFVEPAAAVAVAGALRARAEGRLAADRRVVCVLTGHGFKDPEAVADANRGRHVNLIARADIGPELFAT